MAGTTQNKTYDFKKVIFVAGGVPLSGLMRVTVRRQSDAWVMDVGADGEVARSRINDKRGEFEIELQQTSKSNLLLAGFAVADELDNDGVIPVAVVDLLGASLHFSAEAWCKKIPDSEYAQASGTRTWLFECGILETFPGGN